MVIQVERFGDCRQGKQLRTMEVIKMLCEGPVTRYRIANKMGVTLRTVNRYLIQIDNLGFQVQVRTRDKRDEQQEYFLKECPFCKKELA